MDRPKGVDLADVMYDGKQVPLYIHFQFGPYCEAVHVLVDTDVGKDRLDDPESPGINAFALFAIDLGLHLIDQVQWLRVHLDGKIPVRSSSFA